MKLSLSLPSISGPARRALNTAGYHDLNTIKSCQKKAELTVLHGVEPKATRILEEELKRNDLPFKK